MHPGAVRIHEEGPLSDGKAGFLVFRWMDLLRVHLLQDEADDRPGQDLGQ